MQVSKWSQIYTQYYSVSIMPSHGTKYKHGSVHVSAPVHREVPNSKGDPTAAPDWLAFFKILLPS